MIDTSVLIVFMFIFTIYIALSCRAFRFDSMLDTDNVLLILTLRFASIVNFFHSRKMFRKFDYKKTCLFCNFSSRVSFKRSILCVCGYGRG